ncbi:MAG: PEGA domain-containing protein [Myxococcota bacterium]|nr:PEGA domain-containing protein [Myxococcota bacterium]
MRISLAISILCTIGSLQNAQADQRTDAAYHALRKQGLQRQQTNDFEGALRAFMSATQLKNAPNVWLNMISVRADQAKQLNDTTAYCAETKTALSRFFAACQTCPSAKAQGCSACRMVQFDTDNVRLAVKTNRLAEAITKRGQALRASVASLPDRDKAALQYRAEGLLAKSRELKRCIRVSTFTAEPAGTRVSLGKTFIGETPLDAEMFVGQHTLNFSKSGYSTVVKPVIIPPPSGNPIAVKLLLPKSVVAEQKTGDHSSMRVVGWIGVGIGAVSLATSATFFSTALEKRDQAEQINGQLGREGEFETLKDDSRSAFTMTGIMASVGTVALGTGIWFLLDGAPQKKAVSSVYFTPTGVGLSGKL